MRVSRPVEHKVFIVDDDESVRKALGRLIRSAGLPEVTFASGNDFFATISLKTKGCLLIDIRAGANGSRCTGKLRVMSATIPVIAVSAEDNPATRDRARLLGAVAFFRKPVDDQALLDTILWVMGGAKNCTEGQ
jgi:FixJ family two-component response regulator